MDQDGLNYDKVILGSGRSMRGYILTKPGCQGRTFVSSGFSSEGTLLSASAVPPADDVTGNVIYALTVSAVILMDFVSIFFYRSFQLI